jgi:5-methylcytosine-specific restriction endonuclease McrA
MSTWGRRGLSRGVRRRVLDRDNHTCQLQFAGCTIVATEIDDVVPVSALGDVTREELTDDNRQAACHHCHHIKTEQHKLTRIQEVAAHRRARKRLPQRPHPGEMR